MNGLVLVSMGMLIGSYARSTRFVFWASVCMFAFALSGESILTAIGPYLGNDMNEVLSLIYTKIAM